VTVGTNRTYYMFNYTMTAFGWSILAIIAILLIAWLWHLIRVGRRGKLRRSDYWRRWAGTAIAVLAIAYFYWGAFPNPQFTLANLKGLSPAQVIARLGPPTDKRHAAPPDDTTNESLVVFDYEGRYRWGGFSYGVMFGKNNRVKYVFVGSH